MNLDKMKVYIWWQEEFFTKNEFDILKKIIEASWKIVYRQEIMDSIWYNEYLFDRTIDTHIKNIRKKIKNKDVILTVRGEWYRLNN
jgi:DNA-binding response OmpR family regulator